MLLPLPIFFPSSELPVHTLNHTSIVTDLSINKQMLLAGSTKAGEIIIWDLNNIVESTKPYICVTNAHKDWINACIWAEDKFLVSKLYFLHFTPQYTVIYL